MIAITVQGVSVPAFMYGTAWKEERTEALTAQAIAAGFRAIDTANQRKHYHEAGVGAAVRAALTAGRLTRDALFLQSKFTSVDGQDHRLPYDAGADPATRGRRPCAGSPGHLGGARPDSNGLHGPSQGRGWHAEDRAVWHAMEALHAAGKTRLLGVSNVRLDQLERLLGEASVPPAFVQNRCHARTGWDREVRALCARHGVVYQGFSLLTANRTELAGPAPARIAARLGVTVPQVVFAFARALGMLPLTGSADPQHLRQDLASLALALRPDEIATLEALDAR